MVLFGVYFWVLGSEPSVWYQMSRCYGSLFLNTLQNIPHIFVRYTTQLIYVLEHYQYATKHINVLMFGTSSNE